MTKKEITKRLLKGSICEECAKNNIKKCTHVSSSWVNNPTMTVTSSWVSYSSPGVLNAAWHRIGNKIETKGILAQSISKLKSSKNSKDAVAFLPPGISIQSVDTIYTIEKINGRPDTFSIIYTL